MILLFVRLIPALYPHAANQDSSNTSIGIQDDQREEHDSGVAISATELEKIGVISHHFDSVDDVNFLASERGYKNRDVITVSPGAMGGVYEVKVKAFFHEHLHEDEEIRYVLDGGGFFDVRSEDDRWVRIRVEKGDLIILPAGIYHRFTTDNKNVCSKPICGKHCGLEVTMLTFGAVYQSNAFVQGRSMFRQSHRADPY